MNDVVRDKGDNLSDGKKGHLKKIEIEKRLAKLLGLDEEKFSEIYLELKLKGHVVDDLVGLTRDQVIGLLVTNSPSTKQKNIDNI